MDVFLTGASGYIGGVVAQHLIREGHTVRGLTRTPSVVDSLAAKGIDPVVGELDDLALLAWEAERAELKPFVRHARRAGARSLCRSRGYRR
jgi:uncharacterized protein YbjT (DUF2867 family)